MITAFRKAEDGCIFPVTDVAHVLQVGRRTQGLVGLHLVRNHYVCYSQILDLLKNLTLHQQMRFQVIPNRPCLWH